MEFISDTERKIFEAKYIQMDVQEEYFLKGKVAALAAIWKYIQETDGGVRTLTYDYLNVPYCDGVAYGAVELANFVHGLPRPKEST